MGIVPPAPSWGGMLADAAANSLYLVAWWLVLIPGVALLLHRRSPSTSWATASATPSIPSRPPRGRKRKAAP